MAREAPRLPRSGQQRPGWSASWKFSSQGTAIRTSACPHLTADGFVRPQRTRPRSTVPAVSGAAAKDVPRGCGENRTQIMALSSFRMRRMHRMSCSVFVTVAHADLSDNEVDGRAFFTRRSRTRSRAVVRACCRRGPRPAHEPSHPRLDRHGRGARGAGAADDAVRAGGRTHAPPPAADGGTSAAGRTRNGPSSARPRSCSSR